MKGQAVTYGDTIVLECSTCLGFIKEEIIASGNTIGAIYWTDGKMDAPMLPESNQLIKCPHCHALLWKRHQEEIGSLASLSIHKRNKSIHYEIPVFNDYYTFLKIHGQLVGVDNKTIDMNDLRFHRFEAWFVKSKRSYVNNYIYPQEITESERMLLNLIFKDAVECSEIDYLDLAIIKMQLGEIDAVKVLLDNIDFDLELEGEDRLNTNDFRYLHFKLWQIGNDKRRITNNKDELSEKEKINLTTLYSILDESDESDYLYMAEIKRELGDFQDAEAILNSSEFNDFEQYVSVMKTLIEEKNPFVAQVN